MKIEVWGRFQSLEEIRARIAEIAEVTAKYGDSDGRVTETETLREAEKELVFRIERAKPTKRQTEYDRAIEYLNWHAKHGLGRTVRLGTTETVHISGAFGTLCNEWRYDITTVYGGRPTCRNCIRKAASY